MKNEVCLAEHRNGEKEDSGPLQDVLEAIRLASEGGGGQGPMNGPDLYYSRLAW